MQDTEIRVGQRVRCAIRNEMAVVRGLTGDGRVRIEYDVEVGPGPTATRHASQLTLERQAPDEDPSDRPPGFVVKAPGHGYFVRSRSTDGAWWFVNGDSCSCPATTNLCWHVRRTYQFEKALTEPRPVAPTNVSAMVD